MIDFITIRINFFLSDLTIVSNRSDTPHSSHHFFDLGGCVSDILILFLHLFKLGNGLIALFQRTISLEVGRVRCHVNVVLIARFGRELKRGLVVQHAPTLQVSNDLRIVQILLVIRCVG